MLCSGPAIGYLHPRPGEAQTSAAAQLRDSFAALVIGLIASATCCRGCLLLRWDELNSMFKLVSNKLFKQGDGEAAAGCVRSQKSPLLLACGI